MTVHVTCPGSCTRPLDWQASTEAHAENLLRKHWREYHPGEPEPGTETEEVTARFNDDVSRVNLTAAARYLVDLADLPQRPGGALPAALAVWARLLESDDTTECLHFARDIANAHPAQLIAYPPPM